MEATRRLSAGEDATTSYKTAMYQYTVCRSCSPLFYSADQQRNLMKEAEGITQKANEKAGAFPQFGAKQSGSKSPRSK
jgi:hypothetical protein